MLNNKQQTICFHVEDCTLSHQDSELNDEFINTLLDEYDSVFEDGSGKMKLIRGKLHDYIGMTLDYIVKGQAKIAILYYINGILECLVKAGPKTSCTKSSSAPLNMFVVDENYDKISKEKAENSTIS